MKKRYTQPTIEIHAYRTQIALCSGGGGTNENINTGNGGNPWTGGMAPLHRTPAF